MLRDWFGVPGRDWGEVTVVGFSNVLSRAIAPVAAVLCLVIGSAAQAQDAQVTGQIEWGVWVDPDGCMHWWADGGTEGYMVPRRDPQTGKPVCLKQTSCLSESTDAMFEEFFRQAGSFSYAVTGHTDSRGSDDYNMDLSQRRAKSVADVARSVGAVVDSESGLGESQPVASNATAAGMAKNRRVEILCKKW
jgi:OmpA family